MVKMSSRVLALGTVATVAALATASAAFGAFSSTTIPGKSCGNYGYHAGYGYGYDCVDGSGAGGGTSGAGGGTSAGNPSNNTTNNPINKDSALTPKVSHIIFPGFAKKCDQTLTNLNDSRLTAYYNDLKVIDRSNVNRALTRAEFLKLVLNAANVDVSNEADAKYADVPASHTLNKYIAYATRIGMVAGQNGNFRPDDKITRAEAAKVFTNAAGIGGAKTVNTFADVPATHSLAGYIQSAYDNCLLHGQNEGGKTLYKPGLNITLAETGKVLYNVTHQK